MPHLIIEYSSNLDESVDIDALCDTLRRAAAGTGVFPLAGIRARAIRCKHFSVADGNPDNSFVDISVRLRGGRPADLREHVTAEIFGAAEEFLRPVLDSRPLALSFEMRNIDPALSPKVNSIRSRIAGAN